MTRSLSVSCRGKYGRLREVEGCIRALLFLFPLTRKGLAKLEARGLVLAWEFYTVCSNFVGSHMGVLTHNRYCIVMFLIFDFALARYFPLYAHVKEDC